MSAAGPPRAFRGGVAARLQLPLLDGNAIRTYSYTTWAGVLAHPSAQSAPRVWDGRSGLRSTRRTSDIYTYAGDPVKWLRDMPVIVGYRRPE